MKEPTDDKIKKFWKWCGFKVILIKESFATKEHWEIVASYGDVIWDGFNLGSSVDLNNLFEYVVPKELDYLPTYRFLFDRWLEKLEDYPDPALALFWAIWEVKQDERG